MKVNHVVKFANGTTVRCYSKKTAVKLAKAYARQAHKTSAVYSSFLFYNGKPARIPFPEFKADPVPVNLTWDENKIGGIIIHEH